MTSERQLFKKAILEALSQQYEQELAECKEDAKCSKAHYIRMSEITGIPLTRLMRKRKGFKRTFVAILIAAALLLAGCTVYVYRDEIRDFIEEFYDTYIKVTYTAEQMENKVYIEEFYSLSYVPEEYELVSEYKDILRTKYIWETTSGNMIIFEQLLVDGAYMVYDTEEGNRKVINCGDIVIYSYANNDHYRYMWNDGKYTMSLYSNEQLVEEWLKAILDGLIVKDE